MADTPHTLPCVGGPLDGRPVTVRTPHGFLARDENAERVWLYRRTGNVFRLCLDHDSSVVYPQGATTGERALDWDRMPLTTGDLDVVSVGATEESYAGDPVGDGWDGETPLGADPCLCADDPTALCDFKGVCDGLDPGTKSGQPQG